MRRWIKALAVAGASVTAVVATMPAAHAATARDYEAIGDSYASGLGSGNFVDNACLRTDASYSRFWLSRKGRASFGSVANRACSGATTAAVRTKQLGNLDANTGWVTISAGGNDVGFTSAISTCVISSEAACSTAVQAAITKANTQLPGSFNQLFTAVRAKAPNARVYVLGYPRLLAAATSTVNCGTLTPAKRAVINHAADVLADVTRNSTTGRTGFTFVDSRARFAGHEACTATPWMQGLRMDAPAKSFHPNVSGHKQYADLLLSVTG
ncbi:SGNH/GDSL hydrolase family protein [Actinoplanes sp. NPDC023936]|uniref:SGNH/GDSL hydrolase family protein n=1 Tax=Actinoplanes sp. NPDC023936 TaxID=3154910 RepID=UPI0033EA795D